MNVNLFRFQFTKIVIEIYQLLFVINCGKIIKRMLKILRSHGIKFQSLSQELEDHKLKIDQRYVSTILEFDGSMTKFVMNMLGGGTKPLIKFMSQKKVLLNDCNEQKKVNGKEQTLFDLKKVFMKEGSLHIKEENSSLNLIERSIEFYIEKEKSSQQPKLLYFARSFWDEQKYNLIMSKARQKPIGLNLIEQQVQIFRKINWTGLVDLEVVSSTSEPQNTIYKNLCSRSYSMINKGSPLCELEEFFLPEMFDIFQGKPQN